MVTFTTWNEMPQLAQLMSTTTTVKWEHQYGVWTWPERARRTPTIVENGMPLLTSYYGGRTEIPIYSTTNQNTHLTCVHHSKPDRITTMIELKPTIINPTERPQQLALQLIRRFTLPKQTVLDIGSGSGAFTIAAIRCGRHVIAIEKDERQFNGICQRLRGLANTLQSYEYDEQPIKEPTAPVFQDSTSTSNSVPSLSSTPPDVPLTSQPTSPLSTQQDASGNTSPPPPPQSPSSLPPSSPPPTPALRDDMSLYCRTCGSNEIEEDNPMISCSHCHASMHSLCAYEVSADLHLCNELCVGEPDAVSDTIVVYIDGGMYYLLFCFSVVCCYAMSHILA